MKLRALVVDDSVVYRRILTEALKALPEVEVVGSAPTGKLALQRLQELRPDLVTLDIEMPEFDGIQVLEAMKSQGETASVIVVSAVTRKGGQLTMRALELGAFDFITKPEAASMEEGRETIVRELAPRIRALVQRLGVRNALRHPTPTVAAPAEKIATSPKASSTALDDIARRMSSLSASIRPEMILIGVSTGGPNALAKIIPALPSNIGVPILVVQHMPPLFTQSLADSLASKSVVRVREAVDGEVAAANVVYISPGGKHMRVAAGPDGKKHLQITNDPPENNCRPSVDYLFRSAAIGFPGRSMAVMLTGMGSDGMLGLQLLKRRGCFSIAQDEATCVVYGMPKAVVDAGLADAVLPLDSIAARIISMVRGGPG